MFTEEDNFREDSEVIDVLEDSHTSFESLASSESARSPKRCFSISDSSPFSVKRSRGPTPDISFSPKSPGCVDDYFLSPRSRFITKSVPIPEDDDAGSISNDRSSSADSEDEMPNTSSSAGFFSIASDVESSFRIHLERAEMYNDLETEDLELQEMFADTEARMEPPAAELSHSTEPKFQLRFPAATQQRSFLSPTLDALHL